MTISMNEIRARALAFANEYKYDTNEDAEAKTFWNDFFNVFGINRRRVATFEERVKKIDGKDGYIDLLWKGVILVEHKSKGKDLDKAYKQATEYFPGLKDTELPKYILVSDFVRFRLYNLDENTQHDFWLVDLPKNIHLFGFMSGHQKQLYPPQDPVNIKAAEMMGKLHDKLKTIGYSDHDLEVYLVRLLFCLFADDTGIFEKNQFREYVERRTNEDGSDLAFHLEALFQVLNTPNEKRLSNLDEELAAFRYVNGSLFDERLRIASFDSAMRHQLLECASLDWSRISPAIFGSLFQSVMDPVARRSIGAHYTEETNILKVINSLFLDELKEELIKAKGNQRKLDQLHDKIASLHFLDPACGCGNFLVIAYRELRLLEIEIFKQQYEGRQIQQVLDITHLARVNVDQFYGIEILEFPAQIAQVALWLMDHQMNNVLSSTFGQYYIRLPLTTKPHIHCTNALKKDWGEIVKPEELSYILGNPPFVGSKHLTPEQGSELSTIFDHSKNSGILDYVSAWYAKAAEFIQGTGIKVGYVSTNSITQGEQVGPLWDVLLNKYNIKIHFAHRTFRWSSQARGKAAVHCVIIGFALSEPQHPIVYDYDTPESEAHRIDVKHINPYLVDAPDIIIVNHRKPITSVPDMVFGSMPNDDGHLLLSDAEAKQYLEKEPEAKELIRPLLSAREFIHGEKRWCIWLDGISPETIKKFPEMTVRIERVKKYRLSSKRSATRKLASTPSIFGEIRQPTGSYVLVPRHSSETRRYIPMGFFSPDYIASDSCLIVPNASLFHFGILESGMHMAWVRYVCGRLKSDYRYSVGIVYNNFPWPTPSDKQRNNIEKAAQMILDARAAHPDACLADLYDPLVMPKELVQAHDYLDAEVEKAYGKRFKTDAERVAFLFERYGDLSDQ